MNYLLNVIFYYRHVYLYSLSFYIPVVPLSVLTKFTGIE